ncbi:MAG: glycosyl hydrolase [Neptuniibacter sp.]|nr:glycosyl hydrolase [Neptuniibacter sp.]
MLGVALTGCEAPLNLEGVEQEKAKSVRRTDQFQNITANNDVIVAVGNDGLVLTSPVDKIEWTRQSPNTSYSLIDVAVCPDQSFVALSMDKQVWFSGDNGVNWRPSQLPTPEDVLDLTCAPDNSIWVVGSFSTVLNSKDQGQSWNETTLNEDAMLTGIQFLDSNTAIVTGEFGLVSRSDDAGQSWNTPEYIPNDFYTQGALFTSKETGWVAGLSGQILYTNDAGLSWTKQTTPTESPLYGFYQAGPKLFAFGDHGTILEYTGMDWKKLPPQGKPVYLRGAQKLSDGKLLLAGGSGSLYTLEIASSENSQISQK